MNANGDYENYVFIATVRILSSFFKEFQQRHEQYISAHLPMFDWLLTVL